MNHERVVDRLDRLNGCVNLAGTEPYPASVERRVGSAADDYAVVVGDRDPVPVCPNAWEASEVRGTVPRAVRVSPKADRHRRHRLSNDEPASSNAYTAAPSHRHEISPSKTGTSGQPPTI